MGDSQSIRFDWSRQHADRCVRRRISLHAFTSLKLDLLSEIPRVLYHNKPEAGSGQFLGQLDGQEEGFQERATIITTITTIADS